MLRSFFIFFLLSITLLSAGQNDTLAKRFAVASCDCFGKTGAAKNLNEDIFMDCISATLEENNGLIMNECLRMYGDTTEESAYKFGKQLFENIKVDLVYDCYDFFVFMDSLRYTALTGLNEDSLKREFNWFNKKNKAPDSSTFYTDRGVLKLQLKDTGGAYDDLDKAVRLNKDNISAHLFRGWVLEMRKEYVKAMNDFQYVADATGDSNYKMIVAIVDRKRKMNAEIRK
jgi:tetratricopeptide (TPR) repeat protein